MKKKGKYCLKRNEAGFIFIEVMIALIVFSVCGVVVWQALLHGSNLLDKITVTSSKVVEVLQLDRTLRKYMDKIIIPFWVSEIEIQEENNEMVIPFFEGDENSYLFFQYKDGYLLIGCRKDDGKKTEIMHTFGPFINVKTEKAYNMSGECIGVTFTVNRKKKGDFPIAITAGLKSHPFIIREF